VNIARFLQDAKVILIVGVETQANDGPPHAAADGLGSIFLLMLGPWARLPVR